LSYSNKNVDIKISARDAQNERLESQII
jgi:hypothetical protein